MHITRNNAVFYWIFHSPLDHTLCSIWIIICTALVQRENKVKWVMCTVQVIEF